MRKTAGVAFIVILTVLLTPSAASAGSEGESPDVKVFSTNCASCHGKDGRGQTTAGKKMKLRDLGSPEVQKQTDKQLNDVTANGKKKMPAYKKKLTAPQIEGLVTYMRSLARK